MSRRKPDPIRYCKQCHAQIYRKRRKNGKLENLGPFSRRIYCDVECKRRGAMIHRPYLPHELRTAYQEGRTCKELSDKYHVTEQIIYDDLCALHVAFRAAKPRDFSGEKSPSWKGGKTHTWSGYVQVKRKEHPHANSVGYVLEHLIVACTKYGLEKIEPPQIIHHIDLDKRHNDPSNLSLVATPKAHNAVHWQLQHCAIALMKKGLIQYDDQNGYSLTPKALSLP